MKRTVLLVDDEKHILNSIKRLLRKENYKVLTADTGEKGLEILRKNEIHLVISDQRMPNMSGSDFLRKAKKISPKTVRVILSGYADVSVIVDAINLGQIYRFIGKPWDDGDLKDTIKQCLEYYDQQNNSTQASHEQEKAESKFSFNNDDIDSNLKSRGIGNVINDLPIFLEFFQDVIDSLHIGIISVSKSYNILLTNNKALELIPKLRKSCNGRKIIDIISQKLACSIQKSLSGETVKEFLNIGNKKIYAILKPLIRENTVNGCVITLQSDTENEEIEPVKVMPDKSILIVDDNKGVVRLMAETLKNMDCHVRTAGSAEEGLRVIESEGNFTIILADMHMPGMNGLEFFKKVQEKSPNTTRILFSGSEVNEIITKAIEKGTIASFIAKRTGAQNLIRYLQRLLSEYSKSVSAMREREG